MARAWILLPLLGICLASLTGLIIRLARLPERKLFVSVPLLPEQTIELRSPGAVQLHLVGPRLSSAFSELTFSLLDPKSGERLPSRTILLRMHSSGRRDTSLALQEFDVPGPGSYLLRAEGAAAGAVDPKYTVKLSEPYFAELAVHV